MCKPDSGYFEGTSGEKEAGKGDQLSFELANIRDNIAKLAQTYPLTASGYFGVIGSSSRVRVITSNDQYKEVQEFWNMLSKGGKMSYLPNKMGLKVEFQGKDYATYRVITKTPNSPAIEITVVGKSKVKTQKIHFILTERTK